MPSPLVSVLTPSFNQARWLGDNLQSVRRQTYEHIEHIVMDGGSTDGSVALLESEAGPGVAWRSEPDGGQSNAINKAFDASHGQIIGWLNSDDAYFPRDAVQQAVDLFELYPEIGVVYGHAALVNADGLLLQTMWAPPFNRRLLPLHNYIVQPTAFVRRNIIEGPFVDEAFDFSMDRELWLRLARRTRFTRLNRIVAIDRQHPARKSSLPDVFEGDRRELSKRYGLVQRRTARAELKAWKIAFRLAGLSLVREATTASLAFDGHVDSVANLVRRQTITPRAWMPGGRR